MTKVHVTYVVNGTTLHDELTGARISTQGWDNGRAMVRFPEDDGTLKRGGAEEPEFHKVRTVQYAQADRIVKTVE